MYVKLMSISIGQCSMCLQVEGVRMPNSTHIDYYYRLDGIRYRSAVTAWKALESRLQSLQAACAYYVGSCAAHALFAVLGMIC